MVTPPSSYDFVTAEDTGETLAVNLRTGEAVPAKRLTVPEGSIVRTPDQQRFLKEYYAEKNEEAFTRRRTKGRKFFFTAQQDDRFSDVAPAHMARLVYLATYLNYDGLLCHYNADKPVTRAELPRLLCISKTPTEQFYKAVVGKYIMERDGKLYMPRDFCFRGSLPEDDAPYMRVFIDAIRELYRKTKPSQHKWLGYVFRLLPYVNREYNALCHNPGETDLHKLDWISLDELCALCGYDRKHRYRILKIYRDLTFRTERGEEVFCSFVTEGGDWDTAKIYVNPNVLYKGHRWNKVEILGEFCTPRKPRHKAEHRRLPSRIPDNPAIQ